MTDWREGSEEQRTGENPGKRSCNEEASGVKRLQKATYTPYTPVGLPDPRCGDSGRCSSEPSLPRERGSGRGRSRGGASPPILAVGMGGTAA